MCFSGQRLARVPTRPPDIAEQLARRWESDPALIDEVDRAIRRALHAVRWRWDHKTKSEVEDEDHRSQIEAAKLIFAYGAGLPLQRSISVTLEKDAFGEMKTALRESPALLGALEREVEKARFHGRHKKAVPVDAELPPD